jgi:hypothetical protein
MIKHSIQLIEWLGGVGSTKARVLADETQFDQDVRLTYDLSNAPGQPMGPVTSACGHWASTWAAGEVINFSFVGPPGGAMLRRFLVSDTTITSLGADSALRFDNHNIAARALVVETVQQCGGRQFDSMPGTAPGDNARLIVPFGSVSLMRDPALAALPAVAGEPRRSRFAIEGGWHEPNIYIPPGDTGYGFIVDFVLPAPAVFVIDMEFTLFPLRSTGMPK